MTGASTALRRLLALTAVSLLLGAQASHGLSAPVHVIRDAERAAQRMTNEVHAAEAGEVADIARADSTAGGTATDPTDAPSSDPTDAPETEPTEAPSSEPTEAPSSDPTDAPGTEPTDASSSDPTEAPGTEPTDAPSSDPTEAPGTEPTDASSAEPTDASSTEPTGDPTDPVEAEQALDNMGDDMQPIFVEYQEASWVENTDHTEAHSNASIDAATKLSTEYKNQWNSVIAFYEFEEFDDDELRRRFELQATPGTAALSEADQAQLAYDVNSMTAFSLEKVCPYDDQDCDADTEGYTMDELEIVLATTHDKDELTYYWEEWRDIAGKPTKPFFEDYVGLMNMAATAPENNFTDAGQMWLQPYVAPGYNTDDFKSDVERLWEDTRDLYEKLHTYVRYRLRNSEFYEDYFAEDSPIPAHILGNMWGQSWENIYDLVTPFDVPLIDISETLENHIHDVKDMFRYAENFFTSLGLYEMTDDFWGKSMFEQPEGKIAVCHASAWDFLSVVETGPINDGDFRIKMCTDRTQEDFITIHHEMGHIEYQMAYSQVSETDPTLRPLIFRDGANPGFHEAIGDTIALSVSTPSHLEWLQETIISADPSTTTSDTTESTTSAVDSTTQDPEELEYERNINQLMRMALEKVAFIPYAYILDKFRWDVFANKYDADVYNYEWWKLRVEVQGLKPPVLREKDEDFDPGCKYHVASNVPYIRYFVATILQFQFHEQLCEVGNITTDGSKQVFECDIYGNADSGSALKALLQQGRSKPWTEQLAEFMGTGEGNMTAQSILNYFAPLEEFLDEQISKHDLKTGWNDDVEKYFVQHIPATVPIVVGVVLCCMIVVVVVAYFVGKNKNEKKKNATPPPLETIAVATAGKVNESFQMEDKKSVGSNDS